MLRQLILVAIAARVASAQEPSGQLIPTGPRAQIEILQWGAAQTGVPIVLLHGSGSNADHWRDFAPLLATRHRVVAVSRRGSGRSSPAPASVTIDTLVRDIVTVLDSLRIRRALVVGHSYAGRELTALGNAHANRLAGMVYLDAAYTARGASVMPRLEKIFATFGEGDTTTPVEPKSVETSIKFMQGFGCTYSAATMQRMWSFDREGRFTGFRTDSASGERLERVKEPASYGSYRGPVLALRARWPLPGSPRAISSNTKLIPKIHQVMAILDTVWNDVRQDLPQAEYVELPETMHCVFASRPREASAAILAFVERKVR